MGMISAAVPARPGPDYVIERDVGGFVAGIDEAGRGPLAGPVVAAAVILDPGAVADGVFVGVDDSKSLSPACRSEQFATLRRYAHVGIGAASAREVDRHNVLGATMRAMQRAVTALHPKPDLVLIDGNRVPELPYPARPIVAGDKRVLSIAAASIVAKVTRDRIMAALAQRYPGFGWERNVGYGTAEHRQALQRLGATPHHRLSFAPLVNMLSPSGGQAEDFVLSR